MDSDKLRSWLGLPPGPWPPDDRTLLGLGSGPVTAAEAERRALGLMAKLRPHQLVHPDLVTEGMNRLAQALLAVSMGGQAVAPPPPPKSLAPVSDLSERKLVVLESPPAVNEPQIATPAHVAPAPVAAIAEPPTEAGSVVLVPDAAALDLSQPTIGPLRQDRRAAYRRLAGLRALIRAWDRLRPFFADPSESLPTAGHVLDFLEAAETARRAIAHSGLPRSFAAAAAPRTFAVVSQPLALAVFRSLTPPQRFSLAKDWATSRAWLDAYTNGLRAAVRRSAANQNRDRMKVVFRLLGANPEWMLAATAVAVFVLAGVRMLLRMS